MQHHAPDYRRFKGSVPPNLHLHQHHSPILKYYEKYWSGRKNQNQMTWHQHTHLAWYHIILYYMVGYIALYLQLSLHTRVLYLCGSYERCVCVCVWVNVFTCPTARGLYAGNLRGSYRNTLKSVGPSARLSICPPVRLSVRDQDEVEIIIARQKLAERLWKRPGPENITRFESSRVDSRDLGAWACKSLQRTDSGQWTADDGQRTTMSVILTASERTMQTTFHLRTTTTIATTILWPLG